MVCEGAHEKRTDWTWAGGEIYLPGVAVRSGGTRRPSMRSIDTVQVMAGTDAADRLTGPAPVPGWYLDPGHPEEVRWWDGARWTQYTHPAGMILREPLPASALFAPQPSIVQQWRPSLLPESLHGMGLALQVATVVSALVFVAQAGSALWAAAIFGRGYDEAAASAFTAQRVVLGLAELVVFILTMVLWMVWQYRFAAAMPKGALQSSPGWHAGSWFVPILSLYYPLENVADLRRAVESGRRRSPDEAASGTKERLPVLYGIWWGVFLVGGLLDSTGRILDIALPDPETVTALAARLIFAGFVDLVQAGSWFLAFAVVGDLTRRGVAWLRGWNDDLLHAFGAGPDRDQRDSVPTHAPWGQVAGQHSTTPRPEEMASYQQLSDKERAVLERLRRS